jgi:hypothetical protein
MSSRANSREHGPGVHLLLVNLPIQAFDIYLFSSSAERNGVVYIPFLL